MGIGGFRACICGSGIMGCIGFCLKGARFQGLGSQVQAAETGNLGLGLWSQGPGVQVRSARLPHGLQREVSTGSRNLRVFCYF